MPHALSCTVWDSGVTSVPFFKPSCGSSTINGLPRSKNIVLGNVCSQFYFPKDVALVRKPTMPPRIPISSLLDSDCSTEALRDIRPHVTLVAGLLSRPTPLSALPEIEDCLFRVIEYFGLPNLEPSQHLPVLWSHEDSWPCSTNKEMSGWADSFTRNAVPLSVQHNV